MMIPFVIAAIESDGDRELMTAIYLRHRALMLKTAWQYTREKAEVDDIVSESCVALIRHLDDLKAMDQNGLRSYIITTVRHKAIDALRQRAREQSRNALLAEEAPDASVSFERRIFVQEEVDMVKRAFAALPERERETLTMKYFENKKDAEIAGTLGVSPDTVRKYIMQGRNHLKAMLYEDGENV